MTNVLYSFSFYYLILYLVYNMIAMQNYDLVEIINVSLWFWYIVSYFKKELPKARWEISFCFFF